MIKLYMKDNKAYIWNADDAFKLRTEHRIVGSLIGCFPRQTFQSTQKWLPLQLIPEESTLLQEKGIVKLLTSSVVKNGDMALMYWRHRNKCCDEQIIKLKESRLHQLRDKADIILKGKKNKEVERKKAKLAQEVNENDDKIVNEDNEKIVNEDDEKIVNEDDEKIVNEDDEKIVNEGDEKIVNKVDEKIVKESLIQEDSNSKISCDSSSSDTRNDLVIDTDFVQVENSFHDSADFLASSAENSSALDMTVLACSSQSDKDTSKANAETRAMIEVESKKMNTLTRDDCFVELHTECLWKSDATDQLYSLNYPKTAEEKVRYAVFRDLWEKGYYLTSGLKFGGDFLAYAGDPMKFHALFIVICIKENQNFYAEDIITFGRLGNQVKKTMVLCSPLPNGEIEYYSFAWASSIIHPKKRKRPETPPETDSD